jgi:ubiquinone/menaquinone biosynthesis C-methylase UbiE
MTRPRLPYFDYLLTELRQQNPVVEKSFGRHVHWGYWDEPAAARCDDDDFASAAEQLTLELCGMAGIGEGERVLDVGCGFGGTIASLNERFGALQLTGLNIDGRQLARARSLVRPLHGNTVQFCQADGCSLPFPSGSFDRLLAVECIFHFPSRAAFLKEAYRVLRPGGVLAISDFVPAPIFWPIARLATSKWFEQAYFFGHCDVACTLGRYRQLAAEASLVVAEARNVTRQILPTYAYLERSLAAPGSNDKPPRGTTLALRLQRFIGSSGLLSYYLLSFRKP